jgi:hypothetical protein
MLRGRAEKVSPLLVPPSFGGLDEGRRLALFVKKKSFGCTKDFAFILCVLFDS